MTALSLDPAAIESAIKARVVAIAASLGEDASALERDEIIPATGYIDSAGLLELLAWYEDAYGLKLNQSDITIDNLGSVALMAGFVLKRKAQTLGKA